MWERGEHEALSFSSDNKVWCLLFLEFFLNWVWQQQIAWNMVQQKLDVWIPAFLPEQHHTPGSSNLLVTARDHCSTLQFTSCCCIFHDIFFLYFFFTEDFTSCPIIFTLSPFLALSSGKESLERKKSLRLNDRDLKLRVLLCSVCQFWYLSISGGIDLNPVIVCCSLQGSGTWETLNDQLSSKSQCWDLSVWGVFFVRAVFWEKEPSLGVLLLSVWSLVILWCNYRLLPRGVGFFSPSWLASESMDHPVTGWITSVRKWQSGHGRQQWGDEWDKSSWFMWGINPHAFFAFGDGFLLNNSHTLLEDIIHIQAGNRKWKENLHYCADKYMRVSLTGKERSKNM